MISFKGCNYCSSSYTFEDYILQTGPWVQTLIYCEDSTDGALMEAIGNTDLVFLYYGKVYFFDTDMKKILLQLRPV